MARKARPDYRRLAAADLSDLSLGAGRRPPPATASRRRLLPPVAASAAPRPPCLPPFVTSLCCFIPLPRLRRCPGHRLPGAAQRAAELWRVPYHRGAQPAARPAHSRVAAAEWRLPAHAHPCGASCSARAGHSAARGQPDCGPASLAHRYRHGGVRERGTAGIAAHGASLISGLLLQPALHTGALCMIPWPVPVLGCCAGAHNGCADAGGGPALDAAPGVRLPHSSPPATAIAG